MYDHDLPGAELRAAGVPGLPERHARLLSFIRVNAYGQDAGEVVG